MKKTFLICSLTGRFDGLMKLITSLSRYADTGWNIVVVLQRYSSTEIAVIEEHLNRLFHKKNIVICTNEMNGPHLARCMALDKITSDVWCILDDDMWAIEKTDYDGMADIVFNNKNIGLLSGNWRRAESMAEKVTLSDKLLNQIIVYTGGGMMLRQDVADIIKSIPRTMYIFDNPLWSIYSYVNGYDNYRYMNSVAIHNICTKGGRRKWINENTKNKKVPPAEWIRTRRGTGKAGTMDEYLICDSSDVTDLAKELHRRNKK